MNKIDTSNWKEFVLPDLFEICGSITTQKKELDLDSERSEEKPYPYITTAATNNGISGWSSTYTEKGNVITVDSAVLGVAFYQKFNFTASDHVEKLIPKFEMNENIGKFIAAVLNVNARIIGYAYEEKRSQTAMKKEKIKLPAINKLVPDFEKLAEYIYIYIYILQQKLEVSTCQR